LIITFKRADLGKKKEVVGALCKNAGLPTLFIAIVAHAMSDIFTP